MPAERILVTEHRGVKVYSEGTILAVPRMVGLIARYMNKNK